MCGRYWIDPSDDAEEMEDIVRQAGESPLLKRWTNVVPGGITVSGEIRPTDLVPVIACSRHGVRTVFPMRWGFQAKSLLINARTETAAEKPLFQAAWRAHRCIVPASWYFEWEHLTGHDGKKHTGDKYRIRPAGSSLTWLCGLYRIENGLPEFVILTKEPVEEIRFIHDRMPLMMPKSRIEEWIRPDADPETLLSDAVSDVHYEKAV